MNPLFTFDRSCFVGQFLISQSSFFVFTFFINDRSWGFIVIPEAVSLEDLHFVPSIILRVAQFARLIERFPQMISVSDASGDGDKHYEQDDSQNGDVNWRKGSGRNWWNKHEEKECEEYS